MTTRTHTAASTQTVTYTGLQLALGHVVIDRDTRPGSSDRYHSIRASSASTKAAAFHPVPWQNLGLCTLALVLLTAVTQVL